MSDNDETRWLLPTQIPFDELKGRSLEECLFWLLDGMGARDIEWRIGGKGAGTSDGGRDIEARFFAPNTDGQIEARRWWIECKGRSATLEKDAVTTACNNVLANKAVDCLVIATNTTFSNPTRDWVRLWQERFPTPQILLWDRASLERMLAQQPATVLRLFEGGLSSAGYLQALRERFWNLLEYSSIEQIKRIWSERDTLEIGPMERIALIANEFAHGSIHERPWAGVRDPTAIFEACRVSVFNLFYLYVRMVKTGVDEAPIVRTFGYLLLATLRHYHADLLLELFKVALTNDDGEPMPEKVIDFLLMPIVHSMQDDLQLVCSSNCQRFSREDSIERWQPRDSIDKYWSRFDERGVPPPQPQKGYHRLERTTGSCVVGFDVSGDSSCPLYQHEPTIEHLGAFLKMAKHVVRRRAPT